LVFVEIEMGRRDRVSFRTRVRKTVRKRVRNRDKG